MVVDNVDFDSFDFESERSKLSEEYPSVSVERAEYFHKFLTNDHSEADYRVFLGKLYGEEYFYVFDLELLLHRRSIQRLRKTFITNYKKECKKNEKKTYQTRQG